jgi:hypothetical protein
MGKTLAELFVLAALGEPHPHEGSDDLGSLVSGRSPLMRRERIHGGAEHAAALFEGENALGVEGIEQGGNDGTASKADSGHLVGFGIGHEDPPSKTRGDWYPESELSDTVIFEASLIDLFLGPSEWLGCLVVCFDECIDVLLQLLQGGRCGCRGRSVRSWTSACGLSRM